MSEKGGMVGGVNCKSGMIYGKFVLLQNAYLSADFSLAEVVVYGTREGKGHLISKWFFGVIDFLQKTNEQIRLYYYDTSGRLVFVRFLEEIDDPKEPFRN